MKLLTFHCSFFIFSFQLIEWVREVLERGMPVKTLAENTQNSEKWGVNSEAREFTTFFQLPV